MSLPAHQGVVHGEHGSASFVVRYPACPRRAVFRVTAGTGFRMFAQANAVGERFRDDFPSSSTTWNCSSASVEVAQTMLSMCPLRRWAHPRRRREEEPNCELA